MPPVFPQDVVGTRLKSSESCFKFIVTLRAVPPRVVAAVCHHPVGMLDAFPFGALDVCITLNTQAVSTAYSARRQ